MLFFLVTILLGISQEQLGQLGKNWAGPPPKQPEIMKQKDYQDRQKADDASRLKRAKKFEDRLKQEELSAKLVSELLELQKKVFSNKEEPKISWEEY